MKKNVSFADTHTQNKKLNKMISRRKIISRSLDNLDAIGQEEQEEDVWHDREKLFRVSKANEVYHEQFC